MGICGPTHDERSWTFDLDPGGRDPVLGIERLQEAYLARFPDYAKGITVPAIVDVPTGQVVTNDFPSITHDLSSSGGRTTGRARRTSSPRRSGDEMDEVMERVFTEVNNGVYRCGFAGTQDAYDAAYDRLFAALDWLEDRLADRRYLMGDTITEADVRLFTTLVRFDAVYHGHFKCNRQKLTEMPVLWGYARDLFQTPGVRRHHRLRPDQAALLRRAPDRQPDAASCRGVRTWRTGWTPHGREPLGGRRSGPARRPVRCRPARWCRRGTVRSTEGPAPAPPRGPGAGAAAGSPA